MNSLASFAFLLAIAAYNTPALGQPQSRIIDAPSVEPAMIGVASAKYPPLALSANITGEVILRLGIRKDGSVGSAVLISGHPMLVEASLQNARQLRFECIACMDEVTPYPVTYSYQFAAGPDWPCPESHQHSTQSPHRVTVIAEPRVVHPFFANIKVRSAKCGYIWRCSSPWGGWEYYYFPVRSAKCLDLWNCGHQLREPYATCKRLHREIW
jgi:hypothetical protein